jgi:hypothetical protein
LNFLSKTSSLDRVDRQPPFIGNIIVTPERRLAQFAKAPALTVAGEEAQVD